MTLKKSIVWTYSWGHNESFIGLTSDQEEEEKEKKKKILLMNYMLFFSPLQ